MKSRLRLPHHRRTLVMSGQLATAMTSMQMAYCLASILLAPVFLIAVVPAISLLACGLFMLWVVSLAFGLLTLTTVVSLRARAFEGKC